jgi:hypothetical protein
MKNKKVVVIDDDKNMAAERGDESGYSVFVRGGVEYHFTGLLELARNSSGEFGPFDIYFFDNQVYSTEQNERVLAQDELIGLAMDVDPLCPQQHSIYSTSTHNNDSIRGRLVAGRVKKSWSEIFDISGGYDE